MTRPVCASATVDQLRPGLWEVRVWGQPPDDHERTYTISAPSDNVAAQQGLAKFVEEMETLREWRG